MAFVSPPFDDSVVRTVRICDSPPPSVLQHRQEAGCLPYPCRLTYDLVVPSTGEPGITFIGYEDGQKTKVTGGANERDRRRQARYGVAIRSHHVPVVPFVTLSKQQDQQKQGNMRELQGLPSAKELLALQRRLHSNVHDGDYIMCGGFRPLPGQYLYKPGKGNAVIPHPIIRLQRMYLSEVEPPAARLIARSDAKPTIAFI